MDERGYLTRMKFDIPTGAVIQSIQDVDTAIETDHPSGWITPTDGGLNLITDFEHDDRGRTTQSLGPSHEIDLNGTATTIRQATWYVYQETATQNSTRTGQGYATGSAPNYTYTLINPVSISITDNNGRIQQQIQATRASTAGKLVPGDTFVQSSYTRWKTYQYTDCCHILSERVYYSIPTSGEGLKTSNYNETSYRYDELKRRIATISPGGTINRVVYDARSLVVSNWVGTNETGATPSDPTGGGASGNNMVIIAANQYDGGTDGGSGNLTQQTQYADATDTRLTSYTYDFRNRRIETDGEIDYFQKVYYDNLNRLFKNERYDTTSSGNLLARFETKYDNLSRVYQTIQYGVDPATGNLAGGILQDDMFYDPANNLIKIDPADIELYREYTFDSLNRNITEEDPRNAVTTFTYDVNGNRLTLTDAEGNTTTWGRDALERVVKETNELSEDRTFAYNSAAELATKTDRNGRLMEFQYDDAGRLTEEIWKDGSTTINTITQTYNADSNILSISDTTSSYTNTYDGRARLATASNSRTTGVPTVLLTLTHNRLNERTELATTIAGTADFVNQYEYDSLGRMQRIEQTGVSGGNSVTDKRVDFEFASIGATNAISRYEDLSATNLVANTALGYDYFMRSLSQIHAKGATTLGSSVVTYDTNRRVDSLTTPDGTGDFTYDDSGELLDADYDFQADEAFTYDLTGNRTMTGYSTGPNNQLLSDGTYNYIYDDEGNRTR